MARIVQGQLMIITIVTETYWPDVNGVAMTLRRLVTGLATSGHYIQLVCPGHRERSVTDIPDNVYYQPVKGLPVPAYSDANMGLPAPRQLNRLWRSMRPDVVYVATEGPLGWSAVQEAGKLGIPLVSGFHTNFHTYSRHYRIGFMEKAIARYLVTLHNKTQATIVPTLEQKLMLEKMGVRDVAVMGRGVDIGQFSSSKRSAVLRARWGVQDDEPVMLYVGRIAEEKNLSLTVRTYYALREFNARLKFVLIGNGPLVDKLRKEHPDFIFTGKLTGDSLAEHYASGDIFVFTSVTETFGNVILEAMASGLAIVAYDYAAARTHIRPGVNGVLASYDDAEDFVTRARRLLQNESLLKDIRGNAEQEVQRHSWQSVVMKFEEILRSHSDQDLEACAIGDRLG